MSRDTQPRTTRPRLYLTLLRLRRQTVTAPHSEPSNTMPHSLLAGEMTGFFAQTSNPEEALETDEEEGEYEDEDDDDLDDEMEDDDEDWEDEFDEEMDDEVSDG